MGSRSRHERHRGAARLATENAPAHKRALFGTFPQLGAPIGFFLANGLFLLLSGVMDDETFLSWGWRVPFLVSAVLVVVGLWVRLSLHKTPAFSKVPFYLMMLIALLASRETREQSLDS